MIILAALLGWVLAGILNALADSLPYKRRPALTACRVCGAPRPAHAWLSIIALLTRSHRCDYCDVTQSWRNPVVELITMLGAALLFLKDPDPIAFWTSVVAGFIFLLIVIIDLEHRLILHMVSIPSALILGFINGFFLQRTVLQILMGGIVGMAIFLVFYLLGGMFAGWMRRRQGQDVDEIALGFGDVMLSGVIGFALGWPGILVALFLGILAAGEFSLVYILYLVVMGRYRAFTPIPYGPFLVLGAGIVFYGGQAAIERIFPFGPLYLLAGLMVLFAGCYLYNRIFRE
jgi:prepilin signal peptidase PulO-like enzyme (type II secretory pathway)